VDTILLLAFSAGLFGGFGHCIGMCGPIAAATTLPVHDRGKGFLSLGPHLIYSAGRITAYAFVGGLMGLSGTVINTAGRFAGVQHLAGGLAGVFMIAAGLSAAGLLRLPAGPGRYEGSLLKAARLIIESDSAWKYYPLGIVLGFLPCGLSYTLFIGAAGSGGLLTGMATMISFGIGTLPAMLLVASLVGYFGNRLKRSLSVAGGVAVIVMGLIFLARAIRHYV